MVRTLVASTELALLSLLKDKSRTLEASQGFDSGLELSSRKGNLRQGRHPAEDQFLSQSTNTFSEFQGIMPRSFSPNSSFGCVADDCAVTRCSRRGLAGWAGRVLIHKSSRRSSRLFGASTSPCSFCIHRKTGTRRSASARAQRDRTVGKSRLSSVRLGFVQLP